MSNIVSLKNVIKEFKQGMGVVKALDGVNLEIEQGIFAVIVGPSGSGKSTLLNMLGALDRPTSGEVYIDGVNLNEVSEAELTVHRRNKVGFVFQQFNLIPNLTAVENVMLPMEFAGIEPQKAKARAEDLMKQVKIGHRMDQLPPKLSGGEQQRVAIARALANDAPIILGDEPTGNLDSATGKEIISLFKQLVKEQGKTAIMITHDPSIGEEADMLIRIRDGKVETGGELIEK
jgi:putative ABC transport system ATP-binding protein